MCLKPSPWLDTTKLCWGKVRPERLRLTGASMERYVQEGGQKGLFHHYDGGITTLWSCGEAQSVFSGRRNNLRLFSDPQNLKNGKTAT